MTTIALSMLLLTQGLVTGAMLYFLIRVLKAPPKKEN